VALPFPLAVEERNVVVYQVSMKRASGHFNDESMQSLLERVITELIARDLGIKPEEVTSEFIHNWREEHLYQKATVNTTSRYGGYIGVGRRTLTRAEIDAHRKQAEEFMSRF